MAHSFQIVTDSGVSMLSLNHQLPPIDFTLVGLLQAFYITGKENGGYQPRCIQSANGLIVFEDYGFGNNTYIFILIVNKSPSVSDLSYGHLLKIIKFIQVFLLNLTGASAWISEDNSVIEQLKKDLKQYSGAINEAILHHESIALEAVPSLKIAPEVPQRLLENLAKTAATPFAALWKGGRFVCSTQPLHWIDSLTQYLLINQNGKKVVTVLPYYSISSSLDSIKDAPKGTLAFLELPNEYFLFLLFKEEEKTAEVLTSLTSTFADQLKNLKLLRMDSSQLDQPDKQWFYVNNKTHTIWTHRSLSADISQVIAQYALSFKKPESEKIHSEFNTVFLELEAELIFFIFTEYSTLAIRLKTSDKELAEREAYSLLALLDHSH